MSTKVRRCIFLMLGQQAGVVKNRNVLPAAVKKRADKILSYDLEEYTSNPILIPHAETVELSYDKRQSALSEDQSNLNEEWAESMLRIWTDSIAVGRVLRSTANGE